MNKKTLFKIASVILCVSYIVAYNAPASFKLQAVLIGFFISFVSIFISLGFGIKQKGFINYLILPVLFSASSFFTAYFFQNLKLGFAVFVATIFGVLLYVNLLCQNIFLVNAEKKEEIPLTSVSRVFTFILGQLSLFLLGLMIIKAPFFIGIKVVLFFIATTLLSKFNFSNIKLVYKVKLEPLVVGILSSNAMVALSLFELEDIYRSLILVSLFYIHFDILENLLNSSLSKKIIGEYLLIIISIIILIKIF